MQILQTGQEIMELDHSGFQTSTATVHAANLGDNKYILQVTPHTVSLMDGGKISPTMWRNCVIHFAVLKV